MSRRGGMCFAWLSGFEMVFVPGFFFFYFGELIKGQVLFCGLLKLRHGRTAL